MPIAETPKGRLERLIKLAEATTGFDSLSTANRMLEALSEAAVALASDSTVPSQEIAALIAESSRVARGMEAIRQRLKEDAEARAIEQKKAASLLSDAAMTLEIEKADEYLRLLREGVNESMKEFLPSKGYSLPRHIRRLFNLVVDIARTAQNPPCVFLAGPAGWGKTSAAYAFAYDLGLPIVKVDCTTLRSPEDLFGAYTIDVDATGRYKKVFNRSVFTRAITHGNCVIFFDEINRGRDPKGAQRTLMPVLDRSETIEINADEFIRIGKNVFFFAAANIGSQFTAAEDIDQSLANRFQLTAYIGPGEPLDMIGRFDSVYSPWRETQVPTSELGDAKREAVLLRTAKFIKLMEGVKHSDYPGPPSFRQLLAMKEALRVCKTPEDVAFVIRAILIDRYPKLEFREMASVHWEKTT